MFHYVYILLNPTIHGEWKFKNLKFLNKPFYVGIGVGYRMNTHFYKRNKRYESNHTKANLIRKLIKNNNPPIALKLYENLEHEKAKSIEIKLIKHFGKIIDNTGILTNITNGGDQTRCNQLGVENPHSKRVYQYSLQGKFIKEWISANVICRLQKNKNPSVISDCCRKKLKTAYGFQWFYDYKGLEIPSVIPREKISFRKIVYKFDHTEELITEYKSLIEASILNKINKSHLSACILKGRMVNKHYFSYDKKFIKKKNKSKYHKILFNGKIFILTNAEIVKKFKVSKYYVADVKRGKSKNSIFKCI